MKLRTQLMLSFFFLAVLPLGAITLYSYISSIRALHRAVQTEAARTADEMEHRMSVVTANLNQRLDLLEKTPFPEDTAGRLVSGKPPDPLVVARLLATLGDVAGFIDEFEFTPSPVAGPAAPSARAPAAQAVPAPGASAGPLHLHQGPPELPVIIRLPRLAQAMERHPDVAAALQHIARVLPPAAGDDSGKVLQQVRQEIEQHLGQAAGEIAKVVQDEIEKQQRARVKVETANQAPAPHPALPSINLKTEFGCQVPGHGGPLGHLRARVSTERLLTEILSQAKPEQGEIPFAMDGEGNLFTLDPADLPQLRKLARLATSARGAAAVAGERRADGIDAAGINDEWVVVAHDDPASGLSFGIARPIGASLLEMRRTAARNLAAGLGFVALALFGIAPISRRMTHNLSDLTRGAERLAAGHLDTQVPVRSRDELGQLAQAFNRMARELSANQERLVEQERLRKELEMCRKIQTELLPKAPLLLPFAEVQGVAIPAHELGGDFFNYFALQGGEVALLMGDVSGKGVPAALLMANLQATLRARLPLERDLAVFADRLDRETEASTPTEVYLTLFLGILDPQRRELRYVNAGHESPFLLRRAGALERLDPTGRPIGIMPGGGYVERRVPIEAGDRLFLYTDGLVDAENATGDTFGVKRLETLLAHECAADRPATGVPPSGPADQKALLARVEQAYLDFRGKTEAADDATLLILRVGDHLGAAALAETPLLGAALQKPQSHPPFQI